MRDEYGHISGYGLHADKRDKRKRTRNAIKQDAMRKQFEDEYDEEDEKDD